MGRAKPIIYNNQGTALKGKLLTDTDCARLDKVLEVNDDKGSIADLKNIIFDISESDIDVIISGADPDSVERPIGTLRDYQTVGVAFMYLAKFCLLGDSVGIGKTVQVAGLINLLTEEYRKRGEVFRYLVITENNIVEQFRRELVRFTGDFVEVAYGRKDAITKYLQKYDYASGGTGLPNTVGPGSLFNQPIFQEYLLSCSERSEYPFDLLVVDESSILGNTKTKTYTNAQVVRDNVKHCVILNATAFESNLSMFYSQIAFVDKTILPTKTDFQRRYCKMERSLYGNYSKPTGKYKNQQEFRDLVRYRYFARTRKSQGGSMENCTANQIVLELTDVQKRMLPRTSMPHMVYDNPSAFDENLPFNDTTSPKAGALLDILTGQIEVEGDWHKADTVLVYCLYKEAQENLKRYLTGYGVPSEIMNGETPMEDRLELIEGFKRANYRVLITNVMKGLNFGNTNHIVMYTTPGNVNNMVQFEGRSTRDFNIRDKHLIVLTTAGKEKERFDGVLRDRAKASDSFAGSDYSLVLSLLL